MSAYVEWCSAERDREAEFYRNVGMKNMINSNKWYTKIVKKNKFEVALLAAKLVLMMSIDLS